MLGDFFGAGAQGDESPAVVLSWLNLLCVYAGYGTLLLFGYIREYANRLFGETPFKTKPVSV